MKVETESLPEPPTCKGEVGDLMLQNHEAAQKNTPVNQTNMEQPRQHSQRKKVPAKTECCKLKFSYDVEVEKGNGKTCEEGGGGGVLGSLSELDFCISLLAIYSHQFYKQPARVTLPTR